MKNPLDQQLLMQTFKALANPIRLDIISELEIEPQTVSDLVQNTGHEQSHISHNLKTLLECGFINKQREGKGIKYKLVKGTLQKLLEQASIHTSSHSFKTQKKHTHTTDCIACLSIPELAKEKKSTNHLLKSHTCACKACKKNITNISKTKNLSSFETNHTCHCQACEENQYFTLKYLNS